MFRQLAEKFTPPSGLPGTAQEQRARALFNVHPLQLHRYMEEAWAAGGVVTVPSGTDAVWLGNDRLRELVGINPAVGGTASYIQDQPTAVPQLPLPVDTVSPVAPGTTVPWDHLIYAYLIENTGVLRIFRRVLEAYLFGEGLEAPSDEARLWLRSTEELFFRDPPPFHVSSITSSVRPDIEATRRNAYWRMFGMDLNHGLPGGQPYPYVRGSGANTGFVERWEGFLAEVWQGYLNRRNSSGENSEDPEAVAVHAEAISNMLRARRQQGNLGREEFVFVVMMSWFHLSLESNTPIVETLKASAPSAGERLRKIGERVGLSPHPKARNFFDMAAEASTILRSIELGLFNNVAAVPVLYNDVPGNKTRSDVLAIVNNWSAATGRDVKRRRAADPVLRPRRPASPRPPARMQQLQHGPLSGVHNNGR